MACNCLLENEQNRAFRMAFTDGQWDKIHHRLVIADLDHHPDDPWPMDRIKATAEYILHGTGPSTTNGYRPMATAETGTALAYASPGAPPVTAPTIAASDRLSVKEEIFLVALNKVLDRLDAVLVPPRVQQNRQLRLSEDCHFCGESVHRIQECQAVEQCIREGKCQHNQEGRIVLPSGGYVPNNIGGDNLKAKVKEWHQRNPNQLAAGRHLAGPDNYQGPNPGQPPPHQPAAVPIAPVPTNKPTALATPTQPVAGPSKPYSTSETGKSRSTEAAPVSAVVPVKETIHPFANLGSNRYVLPNTRNFGATLDKSRTDTTYRTAAPIVDTSKGVVVFERVLDSNVTVSVGELCSIAPEIRGKFREAVTQKRVALTNRIKEVPDEDATPYQRKAPLSQLKEEVVDEETPALAFIEELEAFPVLTNQVSMQALYMINL
ncbi:hypothetical protein H0H81_003671 [Sphagnurus paluster]|uniref:Uncharacterized protein n=1 Tax=Sphagnurus paluster TaxID=117069 RepID=A0A9P7FNZ8_9AGAR|nr:hypothetical protein H0H81_003671 [Sphagnurus paluster]